MKDAISNMPAMAFSRYRVPNSKTRQASLMSRMPCQVTKFLFCSFWPIAHAFHNDLHADCGQSDTLSEVSLNLKITILNGYTNNANVAGRGGLQVLRPANSVLCS